MVDIWNIFSTSALSVLSSFCITISLHLSLPSPSLIYSLSHYFPCHQTMFSQSIFSLLTVLLCAQSFFLFSLRSPLSLVLLSVWSLFSFPSFLTFPPNSNRFVSGNVKEYFLSFLQSHNFAIIKMCAFYAEICTENPISKPKLKIVNCV